MRAHNLLVAGLALLVPAMAKPATAAQIDVVPPTANFPAGMILVQGEMVLEDIDQFRTKASAANKISAIVLLDSPGGSLLAGIRIGKFIRMKSWATAVAADTECASACAFAWLGGTKQFVYATSRIGFHAAYTTAGGRVAESGAGNALLAIYLNELGLSEEAAFYITKTSGLDDGYDLHRSTKLRRDGNPNTGGSAQRGLQFRQERSRSSREAPHTSMPSWRIGRAPSQMPPMPPNKSTVRR